MRRPIRDGRPRACPDLGRSHSRKRSAARSWRPRRRAGPRRRPVTSCPENPRGPVRRRPRDGRRFRPNRRSPRPRHRRSLAQPPQIGPRWRRNPHPRHRRHPFPRVQSRIDKRTYPARRGAAVPAGGRRSRSRSRRGGQRSARAPPRPSQSQPRRRRRSAAPRQTAQSRRRQAQGETSPRRSAAAPQPQGIRRRGIR